MTGRVMRKTAMPRGRPPRPRSRRQRRKRRRRRSRRRRKSSVVSAQDVRDAAAGLAGVAVRTPLRFIETLNVYLKLESLQPIGAFKLRGAYNAVRRLPEAVRRNGVITYSSGNHGQALAYAAQLVGVRAVVVMPETAPAVKVAGVKKWGGEVVLAGRTSDDRQRAAEAIAVRDALAVVPPFDHPDIVAGLALVEDDTLREAVHFLWQHCHLAVEPSGAATTAAVRSGAVHPVPPTVLVVSGGNVDPSLLED